MRLQDSGVLLLTTRSTDSQDCSRLLWNLGTSCSLAEHRHEGISEKGALLFIHWVRCSLPRGAAPSSFIHTHYLTCYALSSTQIYRVF